LRKKGFFEEKKKSNVRHAKKMEVMLVHPNARVPRKGSEAAAGFDVYAVEDVIIPARVNVKRIFASLVLLSVVATLLPIYALVSMLAFIFLLNTHIPPKGLVSTGIRVAIPRSHYGRLAQKLGAGKPRQFLIRNCLAAFWGYRLCSTLTRIDTLSSNVSWCRVETVDITTDDHASIPWVRNPKQ
jgi:dUTPase